MGEGGIPEPEGDPDRPLSDLEKRLFGGEQPPPVSASLAEFAREQVARAALRFKGFRQDYERVSNAATAQWKAGQITRAEAQRIFLDDGHIVSAPLVRRYLDARESRQIADWLRARDEMHFTGWLSERNRAALDGMVEQGEAATAVALILAHLKKVMNTAKSHWRAAGQKMPRDLPEQYHDRFKHNLAQQQLRLPGRLGEAALEIAELEPWIANHGSREDQRTLAAWREELAKVRERFGIA